MGAVPTPEHAYPQPIRQNNPKALPTMQTLTKANAKLHTADGFGRNKLAVRSGKRLCLRR
jgi:hypothetical protein